jgi:hypothetical protein
MRREKVGFIRGRIECTPRNSPSLGRGSWKERIEAPSANLPAVGRKTLCSQGATVS